jgi:ADP-heptose:LPS heptosyltransferase
MPKALPHSLLEEACAPAFFRIVVEGLADRFEPALCDAYARLFAEAISYLDAATDPVSVIARYERVRRPRPLTGKPQHIFVLSRITLGADVAVSSVMLAAAKRRFPHANIVFVGPRKNYDLFAADRHIHHAPLDYPRGSVRQRLAVAADLQQILDRPGAIVIDPDSRLTQLGLLPVCPEDCYYFFESRAYAPLSDRSLPELASEWARDIIGGPAAKPFVALGPTPRSKPLIAVSLGVGDNPTKRLPDPFEEQLLVLLASTGLRLCLDKGAGGEEAERVERAIERSGVQAATWQGSFAGFASIIAGSRLYVGYDSAGQHVAAACGVPLISIFAGFPAPRFRARWSPAGPACTVVPADPTDPEAALQRVREALSTATSV